MKIVKITPKQKSLLLAYGKAKKNKSKATADEKPAKKLAEEAIPALQAKEAAAFVVGEDVIATLSVCNRTAVDEDLLKTKYPDVHAACLKDQTFATLKFPETSK